MKAKMISFVMIFVVLGLVSCNSQNKPTENKNNTTPKEAQPETLVEITTDFGTIKLKLYNETPLHRDNFIRLAEQGFYNGTLFHRVINEFMIQGGDPESKTAQAGQALGSGGPGYTVPAEFVKGKFHKKGALAAARMGDNVNPAKESSGSQFYIVQGKVLRPEELDMFEQRMGKSFSAEQRQAYTTLGGTPHLDDAYTVFGEVVEGIEVIDQIAVTQTGPGNRPLSDIKMTVKVIK